MLQKIRLAKQFPVGTQVRIDGTIACVVFNNGWGKLGLVTYGNGSYMEISVKTLNH